MRGLALEGGGAKGAYEAGAIKALTKKRIYFDGVVGTSIGAINAAFYASRNQEALYKLWLNLNSKEILGIDGKLINDIAKGKFNFKEIKKELSSIKKIIKNAGVDTTNLRKLIEKNIKPDRLYKSKIDFGLVTFSLSDLKPIEIFKKDMKKEKLVDYIIASAYLPGFRFERIIDDKYYVDGGIHLNCPVDMLIDNGYDEVYAIKAWEGKLKYKLNKKVKVHIIKPRENLGPVLAQTKEIGEYRFNLGYYDTLKYIDKLDGNKYYFKQYSKEYYEHIFDSTTYKRMIKKYNKGLSPKNNKEFVIKMLEKILKDLNFERFKIYNPPYLITRLKYKLSGDRKNQYYDFVKQIKVDFE